MDTALHNNSSLLPILFVILASFVERPVVDVGLFVELTLWAGWASESSTSASNEPFLRPFIILQVRPYPPVELSGDKEVAISCSFQLKNLGEIKLMFIAQMIITSLPMLTSPVLLYSPSHSP